MSNGHAHQPPALLWFPLLAVDANPNEKGQTDWFGFGPKNETIVHIETGTIRDATTRLEFLIKAAPSLTVGLKIRNRGTSQLAETTNGSCRLTSWGPRPTAVQRFATSCPTRKGCRSRKRHFWGRRLDYSGGAGVDRNGSADKTLTNEPSVSINQTAVARGYRGWCWGG